MLSTTPTAELPSKLKEPARRAGLFVSSLGRRASRTCRRIRGLPLAVRLLTLGDSASLQLRATLGGLLPHLL